MFFVLDYGGEEGLDYVGVKHDAGQVAQVLGGMVGGNLPVSGAGVAFPVVVVTHGDDPGADGDIYAFQAFGIAAAVPVFVVVEDDFHDMAEGWDVLQHVAAFLAVALVGGPLPHVEIGVFIEDDVADGQLADSMQQGCGFDTGYFGKRQAHIYGRADGVIGNLLAVKEQVLVFHFQQLQEKLDQFFGVLAGGKFQKLWNC